MILFWLSYTTFFFWSLLIGYGRNSYKEFVVFLVDSVPPKRDFDIIWPLKGDSKWYDQIPTTLYKEDDDNWIRIDIARKKLSHLPTTMGPNLLLIILPLYNP